jgi:protein gp37
MKATSIEWTDLIANPLKHRDNKTGAVVWACVKTSPGCAHCYSEAIAHHYDRGGPFTRSKLDGLTPFLDTKELRHLLNAKTIGGKPVAGSKCFLGDMTDVFGEWVPNELLDRLVAAIAMRPDVTFQILTKRADRMRAYLSGI